MKNKKIFYYFIFFAFISIITLYSASSILPDHLDNIYLKQLIIYIICLFILIFFKNNKFIFEKINLLYIIGVISLIGLLLFAKPINNAKCWYIIPFLGTFQPSEFIKILIVIYIAIILVNKTNHKFFKVFLILIIPSILTYLQPDTGLVIIYLISVFSMFFCYIKKFKLFIYTGISFSVLLGIIVFMYYQNQEILINIFGDSIFLRVERLINWHNQNGYQLNNALTAIGSTGFNFNFRNINLYYPEAHTDFIFASFASSFGIFLSLILIIIIILFDLYLLNLSLKTKNERDKLIIIGFTSILIYQQIQNIGMNLGLLPITGITLPVISYGGSSLLSYTLMLAIIRNMNQKRKV